MDRIGPSFIKYYGQYRGKHLERGEGAHAFKGINKSKQGQHTTEHKGHFTKAVVRSGRHVPLMPLVPTFVRDRLLCAKLYAYKVVRAQYHMIKL